MISALYRKFDPAGSLSLCAISVIATVALYALMLLPLMVGTYVDHLGFAVDTAGWVVSINLAGVTLMTLICSFRIRHWSLPKLAAAGLVGLAVFDALSIFINSDLYAFSTLRFFSGMAGGAVQAAVVSAIARLDHSDKGYGIYIGFQFLLPAAGFFVLPGLLPDIGFGGLMQTLVGLELLLLLLVPLLSNYQINKVVDGELTVENQVEWRLLLKPVALLSLLGLAIYGAANAAIYAYADRIGRNISMSWDDIGAVLTLANVLGVLGALLVVWLQDRFGHLKPLGCGIALQILAVLSLVYFPTEVGFWLGFIIWSVAWAFTWPYFLSMQADLDSSGSVVVAGQFTNLLGNSAGPALAALLLVDGNYNAIIWLTAVLLLLSLVPMYFVNRRLILELALSSSDLAVSVPNHSK